MNKIKAYVAKNRYERFEIIDRLPEIGDVEGNQFKILEINEVKLDCEQGDDEVYRYNFYEIVKKDIIFDDEDEEDEYRYSNVCVARPVAHLATNGDTLENLNTELIGNGGQSRLDIMLDLESGEVWTDEFYSHEQNSWKNYDDKYIICVGKATNSKMEDEEGNELEGCDWNITIWQQRDSNFSEPEEIYLTGDYENDRYDVEDVLNAIKQLYGELE